MRTWDLVSVPSDSLLPPAWRARCPWRFLLPDTTGAIAWLRAQGFTAGARLAVTGIPTPGFAALLQASVLAGVELVLLNRRLPPARLAEQARQAAVAAVASSDDPTAALALPERFAAQPLPEPPAPLADDAPALVISTSGTGGPAKLASLSRSALRHAAESSVERLALGRDDRWLACLPLDHIGGAGIVHRAGVCGYRLLLCDRFDAAAVDRSLDDHGVTGTSLVPTMLHRLIGLRAPRPWPTRLRVLLIGGGPLDDELIARCAALGRHPCQTYGLTEAASQVTTLAPDEAAAHAGTAGRPLAGFELRVVGDDGAPLPSGHVGAIAIRGPSLLRGYVAGGELVEPHRPDAWFATGDLGELDGDGFLRVRGRRAERIVSGGENVDAAEVEAALRRHPAVADAGVCGLDDAEWGQVVVAALVAQGSPPDDAAFADWLRRELPGFQRPRRWRWVAELPRTELGKLRRLALPALIIRNV